MATATAPQKCGFWDQLTGNGITCSSWFQSSLTSGGVAQVQAVADAAKTQYGANSPAALAAQATADLQKKQVAADTSQIVNDINNSAIGKVFGADCSGVPGLDLSFIGGPCLSYTLLKEIGIGLAVALAAGIALYVFGVVNSFVPRGRS